MIQSIKKISDKKFVLNSNIPWGESTGTCLMEVDLSKSAEMHNISCKDTSGKNSYESKIVSSKAISLTDFLPVLKSIKLEVYPRALEVCSDEACSDYVSEEIARDWTFLFKK